MKMKKLQAKKAAQDSEENYVSCSCCEVPENMLSTEENMVLEKLIELISEQLELDKNVIKETSSFTDDLGAGSLDMIDLAMSIEDEFEIELSDDKIEKIKTVGDLAKFIEEAK